MNKALQLLLLLLISQLNFSQNALNFDGTNDLVQTTYGGVTGTTNRTFEAWIYITTTPTSNSCILDYGANAVGGRNTFYVNASRRIGFISGGTNANISSGTANTVPLSTWTHIAFVLNNGTGYLYINGIQAGTGNLSTVNTPTTGTNLRIGNRVTGGNIPFKGVIDEVRIWDIARTQTEIASTMNTEFCAAPSTLKAYYKMNHGTPGGINTTVTSATDYAGTNNGTLTGFTLSGTTSNWVTGKSIFPVAINSSFAISACGSYTMPDGRIITIAGTYYDTISSSITCDSLNSYVITLTSAIIQSTVTDTGCITYTTPMGTIITTAGTYYDTVSTLSGCDTLIQYDIILSGAVDDSVYRVAGRMTSYDTWAGHQWVRCDSNYKPIPGATNRIYDATQAGDYAVIVTRGSCIDTSDCFNIVLTSISENKTINFSIFPNPASTVINIENIKNRNITGISIIDISGKTMLNKTKISSNKVNIESLETGVYLLKVTTYDGVSIIKFLKK